MFAAKSRSAFRNAHETNRRTTTPGPAELAGPVRAGDRVPGQSLQRDETVVMFPTRGRLDRERRSGTWKCTGGCSSGKTGPCRCSPSAPRWDWAAWIGTRRPRTFSLSVRAGFSRTTNAASGCPSPWRSASSGCPGPTRTAISPPASSCRPHRQRTATVPAGSSPCGSRGNAWATTITGSVHLLAPVGLSVISDIDDTIKVSEVGRP